MRGVARKAFVVAAALLCSLIGPSLAEAGEYKVSACGSGAGYRNNLLTASVSDARMSAYTACPNDGNGHFVGLTAMAGIDRGSVPLFANATQTFLAPAGTTIKRAHVKASGRAWNGDWVSVLQASNDRFGSNASNLSGCTARPGDANGCVSALGHLDQNYELSGATGIRSLVACGHTGGCVTVSTGSWPFTRAYYFIHEFDITLEDSSVPSIVSTGGGLASGRWLRGTQGLSYRASDNSGISRTRFWVDDLGVIADDARGCDYSYAVPCSAVSGDYSVDTTRLADGSHLVAADSFDATSTNFANTVQTINVDNHAPAEPIAPSVVGGQGWHTVDGFTVRWSNPGSAAPVDRAHYELCKSDGSGCVTGSQTANGIDRLSNVRVGQPGDYTIRVWLSDAAGNVSDAKSAPLRLKFDNVAPAQAAPQHRNGWVDKEEAKVFDQEIRRPEGFHLPVSGIAGYAMTANGSNPGGTPNVIADPGNDYNGHTELRELPEGTTTIKARAISGAGIASAAVGSTEIHVDLTAPALALSGQPDAHGWTRTPVALHVTATDMGQLSGMAGGPSDRGPESGGYLEYAVDGATAQRVRGAERAPGPDGRLGYLPAASAPIQVADDGTHTVTYRAFDVAGNGSAEKSVSFKIDQTAPELAVFEAQQQSDPRLIAVAASDRTSGLADGGEIELRRVSPTQGDWITLRTSRQNDHYYAHVENTTLPEGDYQFRATVPDQAGNEATATRDRDGREEILHISPTQVGPFYTIVIDGRPQSSGPDAQDAKATVETKITAAAVRKIAPKRKCKRTTPKRRSRKRCPRSPAAEQLVHELRVPFGKPASVKGTLVTTAGSPISGAEVTVLARPAMAGADYTAEASVRTDSTGRFEYRAPAGSGRTLDFHYRGNETYKHADDQVVLRVPASATIKASRRSVRNGKRVLFTGKLRGRPYPVKGKLLDLQAYYRGKWRTFATPRAALDGKWKYRYRFEATRGLVLYKFRVRVRASSDYPYELGYSKVTKVRVKGP
jgi:hypothetical protein